jgi:hypothetical protein
VIQPPFVLQVADLALYRLYKMKKWSEKNEGKGVATSQPKMKKEKRKKNAGTRKRRKVEELPSPAPTLPPEQKAVNHSELVDWGNMTVVAHDLPTSQQQAAEHLGYPETDEQPLKTLPPSPLPAATEAEGYLADEFTEWYETKQQQQQQQEPEAASPWFPIPGEDFMLTDLPMLTEADDMFTCTFAELLDDRF